MSKILRLTESQLLKFVKNIVEELEYHDVDEMYEDRVEDVMSSVVLHSNPEDFDTGREYAFDMIAQCMDIMMEKYFETVDDEDELRDELEHKYINSLINYWYSNSGRSEID